MGNGPDGLIVPQAGRKAAIHDLEDASFGLDRSVGTLIENAAHMATALRGAVACDTPALSSSSPVHAQPKKRISSLKQKALPWRRLQQ
jgi:hypothetical protein